MKPFAIAGVQMHVGALHENLTAMCHKIHLVMARFPWVEMIVFSELAAYGPLPSNHPDTLDEAETKLCEMAKQYGVWLIPGSMFRRIGDKTYNSACVINPEGDIIGRYSKMFPFMPYEQGIEAGDQFLVFDVPDVGRFGLSICYDIWFPETTRTLTAMGAEVLLHPVLTGTIDRDVELSIARSTAAMFQCFVFDINGLSAGGTGRSSVISPSGSVVYQAAGQEEIIPVEIDFDLIRRQREVGAFGLGQTLKSFRDRNVDFDLYAKSPDQLTYLNRLGELKIPVKGDRHSSAPIPADVTLPYKLDYDE